MSGGDVVDVISSGLSTTDGLAVDWLGSNLFWTDMGTQRIEVAWLTGQYRRVLVSDDLDQPRAIALFPQKGYVGKQCLARGGHREI